MNQASKVMSLLRTISPNLLIGQSSVRCKLFNVISRTTTSSTQNSTSSPSQETPPKSNELTVRKKQEEDSALATSTTARQELRPNPKGPINAQVRWRNPEDIRRIDDQFELMPDPVFIPEPVKQEWIAKIPVEYHGTLPDKFDNNTEWLPIYRLPYLPRVRMVIRGKVYLTAITLAACGARIAEFLSGNLSIGGAQVLLLSSITLGGLIYIGDYFRRLVCQIYVTEDLQYVRICRFTFFGRRRDLVLPKENVIPLSELNPSYRKAMMKVRFAMPENIDLKNDEYEFYEQGLRLIMKYGGILDRERFKVAMGNIFSRINE